MSWLLKTLSDLWAATIKGSIATSMWVDGYTDFEIDLNLNSTNNHFKK